VKSEEEYNRFFAGDDFIKLFDELVAGKLTISQIMLLLRDGALSSGEISEVLQLNPSEVSRQLNTSARQGLVRYDEGRKRFALV
jgi:predicted transcriptional regulator